MIAVPITPCATLRTVRTATSSKFSAETPPNRFAILWNIDVRPVSVVRKTRPRSSTGGCASVSRKRAGQIPAGPWARSPLPQAPRAVPPPPAQSSSAVGPTGMKRRLKSRIAVLLYDKDADSQALRPSCRNSQPPVQFFFCSEMGTRNLGPTWHVAFRGRLQGHAVHPSGCIRRSFLSKTMIILAFWEGKTRRSEDWRPR